MSRNEDGVNEETKAAQGKDKPELRVVAPDERPSKPGWSNYIKVGKGKPLAVEGDALKEEFLANFKNKVFFLGEKAAYLAPRGPRYFETAANFFAYISHHTKCYWANDAVAGVTKGEFFNLIEQYDELTRYDYYSETPEHPVNPKALYKPFPAPDNYKGKLDDLINYFEPASDIDRTLIKAYILTLFQGCAHGEKPAFVFTSEDDDDTNGVGVGKSKLVQYTSKLLGESCLYDVADDINEERFLTHLVQSPLFRIIRYDNVKKFKLSSSFIERFVTSSYVVGHVLRQGAEVRPNYYVWTFTMNGVGTSTDLADRSVTVVLKRPKEDPTWELRITEFIALAKNQIIADALEHLRKPSVHVKTSLRHQKWATHVLSAACPNVLHYRLVLAELEARRKKIDQDQNQSDMLEDHIFQRLSEWHHDCDVYKTNEVQPSLRAGSEAVFIEIKIFQKMVSDYLDRRTPMTVKQIVNYFRFHKGHSLHFGELFPSNGRQFVLWAPKGSEHETGWIVQENRDYLSKAVQPMSRPIRWGNFTQAYQCRMTKFRKKK